MVIVASVLLGFIFLTGLSKGFTSTGNTGLSSSMIPQIYDTSAGIGVLNQVANFTVVVSNTVSTRQVGDVELTVGNSIVRATPFALGTEQTSMIQISQRLNQTGTWTVKVTSNGVKVNSYSFNVMPNQDDADYAISQWESQQFYRNLILICFFLSIVAFALSAASLSRQPKIRLE